MLIQRENYLNIEAKNDGLIKVITGIRRCGKSYLLNNIFYEYLLNNNVAKDHIIKIALDDSDNEELLNPQNLSKYIKEKIVGEENYYVILDEIQLVKNFEGVLNGLLRINNIDIYVTGSNSKFLSSDIVTEFRGRGEEIRIYPLSFAEFMTVSNKDKFDSWQEYITYGGLPLVVSMMTDERKTNYLKEQQKNVYLNDVIERNHIKHDRKLMKLVQTISSNIGSLSNSKKISDTFLSTSNTKIDSKTISLYLKYLEEAFMIEKAERYDVKGKKYLSTPYKYYFTDLGIRNSFINFRQVEETHIMKNIIYLELKRRDYNVDVGMIAINERKGNDLIYKQLEVDFIANKGNNKIYIQSALNMIDEVKAKQEERTLLKINDAFKKIIIVKDYVKKTRTENGVVIMNIFDFLLDQNSLEF